MKYFTPFLTTLLLLIGNFAIAQNFDKYIDKYQKYYDNGDFEKAYQTNEKLKKKSIKKLGDKNKYLPFVYLNKAELQLSKQIIVGIDDALINSIRTTESISGKESQEYAIVLEKSIKLYAELQLFTRVEELIHELDSVTPAGQKLSSKHITNLAEVYLRQGYHNKSLQYILDHIAYLSSASKNAKGKKEDKLLRNYHYAMLLNYAAENYILKGELQKADSVLNSHDSWFGKNLSKNDGPSIYQEVLFAHLNDARNLNDAALKFYEKAYSHSKNGRKSYDKFVLKIQAQLTLAYIRYGKKGKMNSGVADFKKLALDNYPKSSFLNEAGKYLEIKKMIAQNADQSEIAGLAVQISNNTFTLPIFHELKIKSNEILIDFDLISDHYNSAITHQKKINESNEHIYGSSSPKFHLSQISLANLYLDYTNEIRFVDSIYQISWEQVVKKEIAPGHKNYISIKNAEARYYETVDKFDLASKSLDEAIAATMQKYNRTDINFAIQLIRITNFQINLGEYKKAGKYLQMALDVFDEHKIKDEVSLYYSNALITESRLFTAKGMFDEAEKNLRQSKKLLAKAEKVFTKKVNSSEELADIYFHLGKYNEAEHLVAAELLRMQKTYENTNKNALPLLLLHGKIKLKQGDYTEAEQLARQVLTLSNTIYGDRSSRSISATMLLAEISNAFGDFDNAQLRLEDAKELLIEKLGPDHIWLAEINSRLGSIMLSKAEDPKSIELLFNEAKDIILDEMDDQSSLYADMLKRMAFVKIAQKDYSLAFQYLLEAEAIWISKVGKRNNINASEIYILLGDVYYMLKRFAEAEKYYLKSKTLYEKFFSHNHPEYVKALAKLSRVEYMMGNEKAAVLLIEEVVDNYGNYIKYFFPALSEREKTKYWNKIKEDYEYYNTIILKQIDGPNDKIVGKLFNNAISTKAILLNSSIKMRQSILNSGDSVLINQYENWIVSKEILSEALSMNFDQLAEQEINLDSLIGNVELLEKNLSRQSDIFSSSTGQLQITWENIKASLNKNEVAIEMLKFRHFDHIFTDSVIYMALVIKNDKKSARPEVIILKNGRELEQKYFKYYKNMIVYRMPDQYSYDKFWKPIEEKVDGHATIYFSPDGVYTQMNLEAIRVDDDKYVIDNSNIILVSNTKDIYLNSLKKEKYNAENSALIFGDPEFYVSIKSKPLNGSGIISSLPGTEKEVKKLSELFNEHGWKTTSYVQKEASEEKIKKMHSPKVFHIATHGFFTPQETIDSNIEIAKINDADAMKNPLLRSGLLLKGAGDVLAKTNFNYNIESGILTAYEAMNLNLDFTDLVVLSACETGVGDISAGEGVYGLQRAFLVAGARTLIMSMFKVSDEATNDLMVTFYDKWLSSGEMRESFLDAKKELRNKYPAPIYWGAFVMYGLE